MTAIIINQLTAWLEKQKIAYHTHDGFQEHPVAVKHHEEYFRIHGGKIPVQIPETYLENPSKELDTALINVLNHSDLDENTQSFVDSVHSFLQRRGEITPKQRAALVKVYNKMERQTKSISLQPKEQLTPEQINSELQALARALPGQWGGQKDPLRRQRISQRMKELQDMKEKMKSTKLGFKVGRADGAYGNEFNPGHEVAGTFISYDHGDPRRLDYILGYSEGTAEREKKLQDMKEAEE